MRPRRGFHPLLMLAPTALVLLVFFVYPLVAAAYESLHAWDLLTERRFVGLHHYAVLWDRGEIQDTAKRTILFGVIVVAVGGALGLALAIALDRPGRLFAFIRGAVFSAYVVSWVAVALLWMWILDGEAGLLSAIVSGVGLPTFDWLGDPRSALVAIAGVTVWKITGYSMVIFLAGLQDIPRSHYEAAALDGAGPWARFRYVTWPSLRPTAAFVGTTSLILSFQAFDVVRVMTQGGPVRSTTLFVYAIYEQVFINLRVGRASAVTVVFFGMLMLLTLWQLWAWRLSKA